MISKADSSIEIAKKQVTYVYLIGILSSSFPAHFYLTLE